MTKSRQNHTILLFYQQVTKPHFGYKVTLKVDFYCKSNQNNQFQIITISN